MLERIPVPIAGGVNRGRWWNLASAGSGYGSGRRSSVQMRIIASLARAADVAWDVGAHHGYVTLCLASRVGPTGRVVAFEPSERNRRLLGRHVRWNALANVSIQPFALGARDGESRFGGTGTSKMMHLGEGEERVAVRSAESLIASGACRAPTLLKIDVEGAEADVLRGAVRILRKDARLLVAMHSREADTQCAAILRAAGFQCLESRALTASRSGEWASDPDLFCVGPDDAQGEQDLVRLRDEGF